MLGACILSSEIVHSLPPDPNPLKKKKRKERSYVSRAFLSEVPVLTSAAASIMLALFVRLVCVCRGRGRGGWNAAGMGDCGA